MQYILQCAKPIKPVDETYCIISLCLIIDWCLLLLRKVNTSNLLEVSLLHLKYTNAIWQISEYIMLEEINDYSPDKVTSICDEAHFLSHPPAPVTVWKHVLCSCRWLYLYVHTHKNIDVSVQRYVWEYVPKDVCVCEFVIPSPTHYSTSYPRVAFTSDLCSTAGTITERPDSSHPPFPL